MGGGHSRRQGLHKRRECGIERRAALFFFFAEVADGRLDGGACALEPAGDRALEERSWTSGSRRVGCGGVGEPGLTAWAGWEGDSD